MGPNHSEDLTCHVRGFGSYPGRNGESMEALKQGTDTIRYVLKKKTTTLDLKKRGEWKSGEWKKLCLAGSRETT